MKHHFITVEGNIGAGKTTLSTKLSEDCNAKLVLERFADNPFLPKFYKDQSRYAFPLEKNVVFSQSRMVRMFQDSVTSIDYSENIIVIKTLPGAANAVASTLDYAKWPEIIGTVAGDDNILVVIKPIDSVKDIVQKLKNLSE